MTFLDIEAARKFIQQAMNHYQERKTPSWFIEWLDELATLRDLQEDACWMQVSHAVPTVYKLFDRLGRKLPNH